MKNRVEALKKSFVKEFNGYIITNPFNILYFTELLGAADSLGTVAMLVPSEDESIFFAHDVNYEWIKAESKNCKVELVKRGENLIKKIAKQIRSQKLKQVGFDTMTLAMYQRFTKALKNTKLEAKSGYIWNLRRVKDEDELRKIQKAAGFTAEGMQTAYNIIRAGLREYEIAAEIEYTMRTRGSYGTAFESIIASGPRSAYPHGGCGNRKLKNGDVVVVDIGAAYKNYRGDMTRTFIVGKPSAKQEEICTIVKLAQEKAFQKIRDGVKASEPDAVARNIIDQAGYSEYFVHGLGHGIGLEVHEQPVLNPTSKDVLKTRNVVTVEPGIYIVRFGGFRIEDTVLVRKGKAERLTEGQFF